MRPAAASALTVSRAAKNASRGHRALRLERPDRASRAGRARLPATALERALERGAEAIDALGRIGDREQRDSVSRLASSRRTPSAKRSASTARPSAPVPGRARTSLRGSASTGRLGEGRLPSSRRPSILALVPAPGRVMRGQRSSSCGRRARARPIEAAAWPRRTRRVQRVEPLPHAREVEPPGSGEQVGALREAGERLVCGGDEGVGAEGERMRERRMEAHEAP